MKIILIVIAILAVATTLSWANYFTSPDGYQLFQEDKENLSLAVTGDVMFSRKMPGVLDYVDTPFKNVESVTKNVDLLLVNFESPVTASTKALKSDVPIRSDPSYIKLLKANSNVIAALANNHISDFGEIGLNDTLKYLKDNGITTIGAGNTKEEATKPVIQEINGRKIVILNYMDQDNFKEYSQSEMPQATSGNNGSNSGYAAIDLDKIKKDIEDNKESTDLVLVYLHYGNEYSHAPNDRQKNISKTFIDYGADIVVGSHTHVTQGVEIYKDKPIFYNLGNFIFDQSNPDTHLAMFLEINLVNDTGEVIVHPIFLRNYLPEFMSTSDGKNLLNGLTPNSDLNITSDGKGKLVFPLGSSSG
jgi:poly-gamma-glutamate synthesis protein (capsule biosynthesis protein)